MKLMFYLLNYSGPQGGYLELNKELTMPHIVVLPIELYPPLIIIIYIYIYIYR